MRKKYHITLEEIANMFGYSSVDSLRNSSAKERILKGIDKLILLIENKVIDRIKE
jgi:hypothetical protein